MRVSPADSNQPEHSWTSLRRDAFAPTDGRRRAYTLFELILVLSLMAMLVALGVPALLSSMRGQRLVVSAEQVQAEFGRARVDAMESGRIRMFRFQRETGNFKVAPFVRSSDELENNLAGSSQSIASSSLIMSSVESQTISGALEEGVVFAGDNVEVDMRAYSIQQESGDLGISDWSRPVLFYPDGTASDAVIYLRGDNGRLTSVRLRGLTGIARVEEPALDQGA